MAPYSQATLFSGSLLRVVDNQCPGHGDGRSEEECADAHEIVLVRAGVFMLHTRHGRIIADGCTAILFNQGQAYQVSHPVAGGDRCLTIAIRPDALIGLLSSFDRSAEDRPHSPFQFETVLLEAGHHLSLFHTLCALRPGRVPDELDVEERVLRFAGEVLGQRGTTQGRARRVREGRREIVERAQFAIHARFRQKLTLADLAAETYTSPYHLCRVFKAETGQTLHQVVERLRLLAALDDLAERRAPIGDIALDTGFASHSHFTAAFRKRFGQTPEQVRRGDTFPKLSKILTA